MQFKCYFGRFYDEILEGEILHVKPFRFMNEMMVSCRPHRLIDSTKLTHTTSQQGLYDMNVCQQATDIGRRMRTFCLHLQYRNISHSPADVCTLAKQILTPFQSQKKKLFTF